MGVAAVLVSATFFGTHAAQAADWAWPTTSKTISHPFGISETFSYPMHTGVDIDGETGDAVYASRSGIVTRVDSTEKYGLRIIIKHGKQRMWKSIYRNLDSVNVTVGQSIAQGDVIGTLGNTGFSTGDHLHFGLRHKINNVWTFVDPLEYLDQ